MANLPDMIGEFITETETAAQAGRVAAEIHRQMLRPNAHPYAWNAVWEAEADKADVRGKRSLSLGKELAPLLEVAGFDTTALRLLIHKVEAGEDGSADWPALKVALQQHADAVRRGEGGKAKANELTIEKRVEAALHSDPYRNWTTRDMAVVVNCHHGSVYKTKAWKAWEKKREYDPPRRGRKSLDGDIEPE
jgi:hypothetical protein